MDKTNDLIKENQKPSSLKFKRFEDIGMKDLLEQHGKSRQFISKPLPIQKKELKLKSLFLNKLFQKDLFSNLKEQALKKEMLFDNRIRKLLSTKEASGFLGVSENALRILVCQKKVKAYKLGSRLKFKLDDLAGCLQKKEV